MNTNPVHKTIEKNTQGRDFVVGDLHGCLPLLNQFMAVVGFDVAKDRMFSVGDLVDRGPESFSCLKLLREPWFFAVKGNHEQLMEDFLTNGPTGPWWMQNGGNWFFHVDEDEKLLVVEDEFLPILKSLPLVMTVNMQNGGKFHVLHAELMSDKPLTDDDFEIDGMLDFPALTESADGEAVLWARGFFARAYSSHLDEKFMEKWKKALSMDRFFRLFNDKLSTIYSGHTPMRQPTKVGGQVNLDTAAYSLFGARPTEWAGLTVTEPLTNKFWTTNFEGTREVECLVV